MIHPQFTLSVALICSLVVSCSDDTSSQQDGSGTIDLSADSGKITPDLGLPPDLGQKDPCQSEWRDAISAQTTTSTGSVTTTSGTTNTTKVDATAGGMSAAHLNPFIYISFKDGSRVDLDDFAAKKSTAWDLALKRTVIRVNGGDSGAGKGAVAIISGKTLDQVTAVPAASSFETDDFLNASCTIKRNAINNIWTAFGGSSGLWYDYSSGSHAVKPKAATYVLRRAGGEHVKLVIDSFYNSSNEGGHFTIRWSVIK